MSTDDITALLAKAGGGDASARDALLARVYADLEAIARGAVRGQDHSLEPHGLIHELYLRLQTTPLEARDRKHFFAIASLAMRQILVDRARKRKADKRGGAREQVTLSGLAASAAAVDLVGVEQALARLEALSPRQARIVELRCFVGLTVEEVADVLEISERTVHGEWRLARAWLTRELAAAPA